jgi:3-methylcrotonyl-CoA carboxylase alpha subunit
VRIDSGVVEGDTVTIFYDPMIAKLIVWDRTRADALTRMHEALAQCEIAGPKSNIEFLERLVRHPAVIEGRIDTGYLDRHLDEFLPANEPPVPNELFAAATTVLLGEEHLARATARNSSDPHSPWNPVDAWRLGHSGKRIVCFAHNGERLEVDAHGAGGNYKFSSGSAHATVGNGRLHLGTLSANIDGVTRQFRIRVDGDGVLLHDGERRARFERVAAFAYTPTAQKTGDRITAPMPGRIVLVKAKDGDKIEAGQELVVIEAMKMELSLKAPHAATIASVHGQPGDFVEADAVLVRFAEATK